ncbi:MAG TPA: protein translocase subunit SecD [Acidimicrobiales bacterium]|jgi:preprotein translocase subunit SecD
MRRPRLWPLITILVVAFGGLLATLVVGNSPALGLDLQGGASVVLQPPPGTPADTIDQAISIIRSRVDALGVAEPQITRQGSAIVVELPGVKDQAKAVGLVGDTAELRFRPVLGTLPPEGATTTTTIPGTTTTAPGGATTTTTVDTAAIPTTSRADNKADAQVVLPMKDGQSRLVLGPAALVGKDVSSASAEVSSAGEWTVQLNLKPEGAVKFNQLAATCYPGTNPTCPGVPDSTGAVGPGRVAIELDGVVQSAPQFQSDSFSGPVQITGQFKESEAKQLALVLRYGALPVQLEQQSVRTVSASLGTDSLRAGIIAGAIGTALVLLYMVLYYRKLGLVVIGGLIVWSALQWTIISYLGSTRGLALSLAGVTGIVVSVGVTVDSYVVYFERLRDEIRLGRPPRTAADRSFTRAFKTILVADASALIGAITLYWLTVGAVRGFAFYLGLSTVLDITVTWCFTRVVVGRLARRPSFASYRFLRPPRQPVPVPAGVAS